MNLTVTNLRDYANIIEELELDDFEIGSFDGKILYLSKEVKGATVEQIANEIYKSVDTVMVEARDLKKGSKPYRYTFVAKSESGSYDFIVDVDISEYSIDAIMTFHN